MVCEIGDFAPPGAKMWLRLSLNQLRQSHMSLNSFGKSWVKIAQACSRSSNEYLERNELGIKSRPMPAPVRIISLII